MGIQEAVTLQHWNYFLALDDDVSRLSRYVEPTIANFSTYSLEISRVLFAASSEVDVVAKGLCRKIDPANRVDNISECREAIVACYPQIPRVAIAIPRFGLHLTPWDEWGNDSNPLWWKAYNHVKHHRDTHFHQASLMHALNAVAGLFVLVLLFYREEAETGKLGPNPGLFRAGQPFEVDRLFWSPDCITYKLTSSMA